MEQKSINVGIVLILVVVVGFMAWQGGYQAGWGKAKDKIEKSGMFPGAMETKVLNGQVTAVGDSSLGVKVFMVSPLASEDLTIRTVIIGNDTIIERNTPKDMETLRKEQAEFMEEIKKAPLSGETAKAPVIPPEPFTREIVTIKDIKVGDNVMVEASENVSAVKEFTAARISLTPSIAPAPLLQNQNMVPSPVPIVPPQGANVPVPTPKK